MKQHLVCAVCQLGGIYFLSTFIHSFTCKSNGKKQWYFMSSVKVLTAVIWGPNRSFRRASSLCSLLHQGHYNRSVPRCSSYSYLQFYQLFGYAAVFFFQLRKTVVPQSSPPPFVPLNSYQRQLKGPVLRVPKPNFKPSYNQCYLPWLEHYIAIRKGGSTLSLALGY